jgi:hypothetical protein
MDVIKSSRAISRVNVELKTNVSETSSVSIIRVRDTDRDRDPDPDDGHRASLRNLVFNSTLTRLIAREDFITFSTF